MKTDRENNAERETIIVIEKKTSPKKEALAILLIGVVVLIGFSLFFLFFYRPFVPWKKIVCSEETGTFVYNDSIREVTYIYQIDGIWYYKTFSRNTVPNQSWPFEDVPYTIYINVNDPTDVKQGNRGGFFLILINSMFIITGGCMIGISLYKFNQIKKQKNTRAKK